MEFTSYSSIATGLIYASIFVILYGNYYQKLEFALADCSGETAYKAQAIHQFN